MTVDDDADLEADIRAVFESGNRESVEDLARQMREAGFPRHAIEFATADFAKTLADRLERDMPLMLRDVKISAGEIRLQ